jgi:hypothetical protein
VCYVGAMRSTAAGTGAQHVSRDVDASAVRDLLDHPPHATVAFVDGDAVDLLPACARFSAGMHLFAVLSDDAPDLKNREVVLVIDDGPYWFELRGISVRGVAVSIAAGSDAAAKRFVWYAIAARRVLAWDYGSIHEE